MKRKLYTCFAFNFDSMKINPMRIIKNRMDDIIKEEMGHIKLIGNKLREFKD